jgi:hypothetical protein
VTGEITAVKAENSKTFEDKPENAAKYAIDLDLDTTSQAGPNSNKEVWAKLTLDQIHCVKQFVVYYQDGKAWQTWSYSYGSFTCKGSSCSLYSFTVTATAQNLPIPPDCKYGDTLKFERVSGNLVVLTEISIAGKEGEILETST